jgi:hypothetical protein
MTHIKKRSQYILYVPNNLNSLQKSNLKYKPHLRTNMQDNIPHMQKHVKAVLNGNASAYPEYLLYNMYMVTNGLPSSTETFTITMRSSRLR